MPKWIKAIAFLAFAILPSASMAQQLATRVATDARGYTFTMCNAEATTGVCDAAAGDIYAVTDRYDNFGFYYSGTDALSNCTAWALPSGTTIVADLTSVDLWRINATTLSDTNPVQWFSINAKYIFVSCSVNSGTVTVKMMASEPGIPRGD